IESPPGGTHVPRGRAFVGGWAMGTEGPMTEVLVLVDGRRAMAARVGSDHLVREDVAAMYPGVPAGERSGWDAVVDVRWVEGPTATLSVLGRTGAGDWVELDRAQIEVDRPISPSGGRRAVFTIMQNEPRFLPLWLRYYGAHFDAPDMYVLDHDSDDGSTQGLDERCNVVAVHRDVSFDHMWLNGIVEDFQAFLLRSYDTVLFTEADEFIVADPERYAGLGEYIERMEGLFARCTGYNVVHYPDEPPLRFEEPILRQRRYWHPSPQWYSKRVLSRIPLSWHIGFHQEFNVPEVEPDPGLCLIHLHRVDYEYCLARHRAVVGREWHADDRKFNLGWHYRIVETDEFRDWFFHGKDLEGTERELIPDRIRDAL
ncbi:MAG: glycosyltransferase family 2 protein, partial [Solirubrobacterales bacterium]